MRNEDDPFLSSLHDKNLETQKKGFITSMYPYIRWILVLTVVALSTFTSSATYPHLPGLRTTVPTGFERTKHIGNSSLYEIRTESNDSYGLGNIIIANLTASSRFELGQHYAKLLGNETYETYETFIRSVFPKEELRVLFEAFADWLWQEYASKYVPSEFQEELDGMRNMSSGLHPTVDVLSRRFNTLANLPADSQNIVSMLEFELEKSLSPGVRDILNGVIDALDKCTWCSGRHFAPWAPGCDSFAVWGSRTREGRLFSSRNLDWDKDTGIARHKLITLIHLVNEPAVPSYATFGFASGIGALAGMSAAGITTSEMNLDNSETTFDGPPFPLRLRMVLERARSLSDARTVWEETNNTDSMNFLIASGFERDAFEIEAIRSYSAFFHANDPIEAAATCRVETERFGGTCGDAFPNVTSERTIHIGSPLTDAVWRTNHAFHPTIMHTQEPLFNDTTFRYMLLKNLFDDFNNTKIDDNEALTITSILAVKGPNFLSCEPSQFADGGSNIMSIVYAPHRTNAHAWVAFEDGTGDEWVPAACNPYVRIDFDSGWW